MSGIAGWLTSAGTGLDGHKILEQMLAQLGPANEEQNALVHGAHALASSDGYLPVDVCFDDGLLIAVVGQASYQSESGARAVQTAYLRQQQGCFAVLSGQFAIVILDPQQQRVLLAVDKMGLFSLYFSQLTQGFVFGSTASAVIQFPAVDKQISSQGIYNYLFHHMVPAPGTIYQGVEKLLPAQFICWQAGKLERQFYWQPDWSLEANRSFASYQQQLKKLLQHAVGEASNNPLNIGTFLSGGLDSSTVTGVFARSRSQPVASFSMGFDAEGFDEIAYARIASRHFGTTANEYYVTPDDVVEAIPLIASAYDEPFGNASAVPTYFCALKAKQAGIELMLAGDGGDEIFGGNERYAKQTIFEIYGGIPSLLRSKLIEPVATRLPAIPPFSKVSSYVKQARVPLPDRLETYNFLHNAALHSVFTAQFLGEINEQQPLQQMRDVYARTGSPEAINRMLFLDWKQTLADNDLRKVNRMCQLAGVKVAYPLLNQALVDFSTRLPINYKVKSGQLRWFYKQALADFLPHEIIHKSKHGFGLPFGLWLNKHPALRELAHQSLIAFRERNIIQASYLDQLEQAHQQGHASYYGVMIWVIMMLEQWLQKHR